MQQPSQTLLQDISTRFILTAPAEQLESCEHMMFLVEQAWWYYEDQVRHKDPSLRSYSFKEFAAVMFKGCSDLLPFAGQLEEIMERFKKLKGAIPVMGAILLDRSLQCVLLVKGWNKHACWGFPKGKINKNELEAECAVREVLEETGYDIDGLIREEDHFEMTLDGKRTRLYIVPGVDSDTQHFAPKCRGEIGGFAWHNVADLPSSRETGALPYTGADGQRYRFYGVWQFMEPLKRWIRRYRQRNGTRAGSDRGKAKARGGAVELSGGSQGSTSDSQDFFAPSLLAQHGAAASMHALSSFTFDTDSIMTAMQQPLAQG